MFKILLSALLLISGCIGAGTPQAFATVSSNITKVIYNGDGVSTSFNFGTGGYSVPVYYATDIQVYTQNVANGTITQLTLNTNYSVTLTQVPYSLTNTVVYYTAVINLAGGSMPYGALPVGTNLIINRSIPYTNVLNITDYAATPATTWNQGYDRATMLAQQLYTLTQQAVLQPVSATTPISIPSANNGYILCWSAGVLANCANNGSGTPIAIPIPNSDLSTLTQAGLVNGSSLTGSGTMSSLILTGNLGINSTAPGQLLDVVGTIRANGFINAFVPTKIQVFTSTNTWTRPSTVNNVYVKVIGAGGNGGTTGGSALSAGGGGGGGYAEGIIGVTGNVTVTIGSTNSFAGTTTIQATAGSSASSYTPGTGGTGSGGTINLTGATGQAGTNPSASTTQASGGNGGGSVMGPGGGGGLTGAAGTNGGSYGGGGGGAGYEGSGGGTGDAGAVIVYY